jgi:hypothetical protein
MWLMQAGAELGIFSFVPTYAFRDLLTGIAFLRIGIALGPAKV